MRDVFLKQQEYWEIVSSDEVGIEMSPYMPCVRIVDSCNLVYTRISHQQGKDLR